VPPLGVGCLSTSLSWVNLYFLTCFKAAFHLVLSHPGKWIRSEMRQNLPPHWELGEENWRIGSGIFQIQHRNRQRTDFATGSELPEARNGPNSDEFGPLSVVSPFTVGRFSVACRKITRDDQVANQMDAIRISESTQEVWALPGHWYS
jgi:hypothetical protein